MRCIQQEVQVNFRYPVHFTSDVFSESNPLLRQIVGNGTEAPRKVMVVVDRGV